MVKIEFLGAEEAERFYEDISKGGFTYRRDETDYSDWDNFKPKYTRIDVTIDKINKAKEALVIFGHIAPDQNGIDQALESRRYLFQIDYTESEIDEKIIDKKISPREIVKYAKLEAEAGDNTLLGGLALQTLAFQKGRGLLEMNGAEVEAHINFKYLYKKFSLTKIDGSVSHLFEKRYLTVSSTENMDMLRADAHRFLKSNFKPILTWGKRSGKFSTFLNNTLYKGIKQMYYKDVEAGIVTRKIPYGYKVIPTTKAYEFAMAVKGKTDHESVNNLIEYLLQEDVVLNLNTRYKKSLWKEPSFYTERKVYDLTEEQENLLIFKIREILQPDKRITDRAIKFHLSKLSEWFSPGHNYKIQVGFETQFDQDSVFFKDWTPEPVERGFERTAEQSDYGNIYKDGDLIVSIVSEQGIDETDYSDTVTDIAQFYKNGRATFDHIEDLYKYLFKAIKYQTKAKVKDIAEILEIPERTFNDVKYQLRGLRFFFRDERKRPRYRIRKIYGSPKLYGIPDIRK